MMKPHTGREFTDLGGEPDQTSIAVRKRVCSRDDGDISMASESAPDTPSTVASTASLLWSEAEEGESNSLQRQRSPSSARLSTAARGGLMTNFSNSYLQLRNWWKDMKDNFGMNLLLVVSTVYWSQGFKSISRLAINYILKDELKLDPSMAQAVKTTSAFPWMLKPLYGILSDSMPLWGLRRKPYLLIMTILAFLAVFMLSFQSLSPTTSYVMACLVLSNLGVAFSDVVVDAKVVEEARSESVESAGDLQSLSWFMMSLGGVMGGALGGYAVEVLGSRNVVFCSLIGPALVIGIAFRMSEARTTPTQHGSCFRNSINQMQQLIQALKNPIIWRPTLWIYLSNATAPSYGDVFFYFQTSKDGLNFSPEFLSFLNVVGYGALMIGTSVFNAYLKHIPFRTMLCWTQVGTAVLTAADLLLVTRANRAVGIPDKVFVFGGEIMGDVIDRLKNMPFLVLCARLCPPGIEGTMFALFMAIFNFSWATSSYFGAIVCSVLGVSEGKYDNLWIAVLLRTIGLLVPLFLLDFIPVADPQLTADTSATESESGDRGSLILLPHDARSEKPDKSETDNDNVPAEKVDHNAFIGANVPVSENGNQK